MTRLNRLLVAAAVVLVVVIAAAWRPAAAQAQRTDDILPALLTEVKGLRAAMEQMASAGAQAQLLVGRLQLQETRINGMIRRLDTVRDSVASAEGTYNQINGSLKMLGGEKEDPGQSPQERNEILENFRRQAAAAKANVDRLKAEEMQLTNDVAAEQGRWIEINRRLDDLERAIGKR